MSVYIDKKALVDPGARIDSGVRVGPYAVIGKDAKIGSGSVIDSFAQVIGHTEIGGNCRISSYAVVGSAPQDLKYEGKKSFLEIGDDNVIREFVTVNPGTDENSRTVVGSGNLIMAYSHIAHDCRIGDNNILANAATLAGYVQIADRVVVGGLVAIHQFCRIGHFSIIGGCSKVVQDVPPYSICDGHPAAVRGVNLVGLKRAGFPPEKVRKIKSAFRELFFKGRNFKQAEETIRQDAPVSEEIDSLIRFVSSSKRGVCRKNPKNRL